MKDFLLGCCDYSKCLEDLFAVAVGYDDRRTKVSE